MQHDKQLIHQGIPSDYSKTLTKKSVNNISFDPSIKVIPKKSLRNFPQTTVSKRVSLQSSKKSLLKERSGTDKNTNNLDIMEKLIQKAKKELKENERKHYLLH